MLADPSQLRDNHLHASIHLGRCKQTRKGISPLAHMVGCHVGIISSDSSKPTHVDTWIEFCGWMHPPLTRKKMSEQLKKVNLSTTCKERRCYVLLGEYINMHRQNNMKMSLNWR